MREHQLGSADVTVAQTLGIAHAAGLRAHAVRLRWEDLFKMGTAVPAIVLLRNGTAMVLMAAAAAPSGLPVVVLRDPGGSEDAPLMLDEARFTAAWTGDVILIKRDYRLRDEDRPFGLGWVVGQLLRDRRVTRDLAICAVLLGILAISPVLFWRVMVDRVMYYGSMSTFTMLCIAFLVLLLFETIFGHLRRYLVLFVTTRVDVKIWTHMFNKMLNLPIDFFERTPTGEIVHDMYEIYRVRQFLTGQLFGTLAGFVRPGDLSADHVHGQHDHDVGRAGDLPADLHHPGRDAADRAAQGRHRGAGGGAARHPAGRGGARHSRDQVAGARRPPAARIRRAGRPGGGNPVRRGTYRQT